MAVLMAAWTVVSWVSPSAAYLDDVTDARWAANSGCFAAVLKEVQRAVWWGLHLVTVTAVLSDTTREQSRAAHLVL